MIKDYSKPFILWASPRTGSSAFFYEYAKRNNIKIIESNHEPLSPYQEQVNIEDFFKKQISFKFMLSRHGQEIKEYYQTNNLSIFLQTIPVYLSICDFFQYFYKRIYLVENQ